MKKLKQILFFNLMFLSFLLSENDSKGVFFKERSTSFGMMSEKLGTDFWNFSWTTYKKGRDEIFISIGPSILIPTNAGLGWKHYFSPFGKAEKLTPYSCFSFFGRTANKMNNSSGDSTREDNCIGLSGGVSYLISKSEKKSISINTGIFISYDFRNKPFTLPVINIELKRF